MNSNSWTDPRDGIVIYFHLVAPKEPQELLLAAGCGELHDLPTVAMPYWLFEYIFDTLRWIPTERGALIRVPMERPFITSAGAAVARRVFAGWKQLFSISEKDVLLTRGGTIPATKVLISREELVGCFESLEKLTLEIESGKKVIYCSDALDYRATATADMSRRIQANVAV